MSGAAKYPLTPEAQNVHGRLARLYETGAAGKGALLAQCAAGGMMLKECGLLDTITMLDQHPAYQEGSPSERRAILIKELLAMLGSQVEVHQPTRSDITQPEAAPVVAPSRPAQASAAGPSAAPATQTKTLPKLSG